MKKLPFLFNYMVCSDYIELGHFATLVTALSGIDGGTLVITKDNRGETIECIYKLLEVLEDTALNVLFGLLYDKIVPQDMPLIGMQSTNYSVVFRAYDQYFIINEKCDAPDLNEIAAALNIRLEGTLTSESAFATLLHRYSITANFHAGAYSDYRRCTIRHDGTSFTASYQLSHKHDIMTL